MAQSTDCNSAPEDLTPSSGLLGALHAHGAQTHAGKAPMHTKVKEKKEECVCVSAECVYSLPSMHRVWVQFLVPEKERGQGQREGGKRNSSWCRLCPKDKRTKRRRK